jgi:hypothetical protein
LRHGHAAQQSERRDDSSQPDDPADSEANFIVLLHLFLLLQRGIVSSRKGITHRALARIKLSSCGTL